MAIARVKTWSAGEVLTASDLNTEFNNFINNPVDLWSPAGKAADFNGYEVVLDADADTSITSDTDDRVDVRLGGVDVFRFDGTTASTVNGIDFVGTITAVAPIVKAQGSDTNIGIRILPKGTGATNAVNSFLNVCEFRLTLTSGTPVTTGDVTAAGTLYCSPYKGNRIALFDGTDKWEIRTSAEFSLALTLTSGKPYDIFCYDNSGTPTLESLVWTNDTTRATALTLQNGVLVKTGATTRRYLGTIYASGSNTTEDSFAKRYVWNYYNRVVRPMRVLEATNTWTYTTQTLRQANASTANQLDFVIGVSEDIVAAEVIGQARNSTAAVNFSVGIGLDSTSANATGVIANLGTSQIVNYYYTTTAKLKTFPAAGRHTLVWLEQSTATDTTTWAGDDNIPSFFQSGIHGELLG